MTNPDFSPQALRITIIAAGIAGSIVCAVIGVAVMP